MCSRPNSVGLGWRDCAVCSLCLFTDALALRTPYRALCLAFADVARLVCSLPFLLPWLSCSIISTRYLGFYGCWDPVGLSAWEVQSFQLPAVQFFQH